MLLGIVALMVAKPALPYTSHLLSESWKRTQVVGHRGAAAYAPENTLASFERAIADGAPAVECDVHVSRDGEVVVMHDATLDRTTKLSGDVAETDWSTMRDADVPRLADLTALTHNQTVLVVEIKAGEGVEQKVVDHLKEQKMVEQTIVFSFKDKTIEKVKKLNPDQTSAWLLGAKQTPETLAATFERLQTIVADGIGTAYTNCPPELVAEAHKRKIPVFVWTVPPGPEVDLLVDLRVNFVITNHPREVLAQLAKMG